MPYLVQEYISLQSLDKFFESEQLCVDRRGKFHGLDDSGTWFNLAKEIVQIVRRIHNHQILHRDIAPKNILIKNEGGRLRPILVDFGQSMLLDVSLDRALQHPLDDAAYTAPECLRTDNRYTNSSDIFSLGGVLYYLATGQKPRCQPAKTIDFQDEEYARMLRNYLFEGFQQAPLRDKCESIITIIEKCMRPLADKRYPTTERLLQALASIDHSRSSNQIPDLGRSVLSSSLEAIQTNGNPFFKSLVADKVSQLNSEIDDMREGHFEISGERDALIETLVRYLSILESGDLYVTVTFPEYWSEHNLGVNGRFLMINKDLVRRGIHIRRLFLVTEDEFKDPKVKDILLAHKGMCVDLDEYVDPLPSFGRAEKNEKLSDEGSIYVGYMQLHSEAIEQYKKNVGNVAVWVGKAKNKMSVTFWSRSLGAGKPSQIVKARFLTDSYANYDQMLALFDDEAAVKPILDIQS